MNVLLPKKNGSKYYHYLIKVGNKMKTDPHFKLKAIRNIAEAEQ